MNKGLKKLLKILKELYSIDVINKIASNTNFVKRESKITPEIFLSLCLFSGEDLCRSTLLQLSTSVPKLVPKLKRKSRIELEIY